ncbi:MAG TPA: NADH-quinone oxidoreductase subunit L [Dehalococcoidia bacterium]|nr:NADH-quinone oxidoreductase subunit L [Dehalococcoidia bacterium]
MSDIPEGAAWAIYFVPLSAAVLIAALLRGRPREAGRLMIVAVGVSWLLALWALATVRDHDGEAVGFAAHSWVQLFNLDVAFGIRLDGLTGVMLVVVTSVALLVQVYSTEYMRGDGGYSRYYAYMGLFTSSMLGLVLASSLLQLFIYWELVGLSSYLLIGFWFQRPSAAAAAKKAFIVTRFGDFGFLLGVLLIWSKTGDFDIATINAHAEELSAAVLAGFTLGLFAGAVGKSAQFPLHIWLPDAMEGPTPVSALIHAATMVAAGVYLIARFFPTFEAAPSEVRTLIAYIGAVTALLAATMGIVATDIKRVLAYSTISQLGYMVMALGLGGYVAAIFHLFTHAFFKALLFLGSGSVNHATGTFDMRKMGGLRSSMPVTWLTFLIGSLSLSGVFPLAGFWSKDEVLLDAWEHNRLLFAVGVIVAFMTAFYMFRAIFMTFFGEYRGGEASEHGSDAAHHSGPHESPLPMWAPLAILAVPAVLIGFVNVTGGFGHLIEGALPEALREGHPDLDRVVLVSSTLAALFGIGAAAAIYFARTPAPEMLRSRLGPLPTVVENKYYMDVIAEDIIVRRVLYGGLARAAELFDTYVVDMAVNTAGRATRLASEFSRRTTFGQQQAYSSLLLAGVVAAVVVLFVLSGNVLER